MERSFIAENDASRDQLKSFVASLSDQDLTQPVGEHWTAAIALLHLAFWDRQWMLKFREWERVGSVVIPASARMPVVSTLNDGMLGWWRDVAPSQARVEVVDAAEAIDLEVAKLSDSTIAAVMEVRPRTLVRAVHRKEHLGDIAVALGRTAPIP